MATEDEPEETMEQLLAQLSEIGSELDDIEVRWRDPYNLLKSQGYMLRPRLRLGWVPSWKTDSSIRPDKDEDFITLLVSTRARASLT